MNREAPNPTPIKRKQYETPRVAVYGDVREITRAVGSMGKADGGSKGTAKTA